MGIEITINGEKKVWDTKPSETLLDALRNHGYKSVKRGCDEGHCGACTVLVDGKAIKSCVMLAGQAHKRNIVTIEGIGTIDEPHPLQKAFVHTGGVQCGYCVPGMILSAKALLDENPVPTEEEIKTALDGNLCRCTGYVKQVEAVGLASKMMRGEN
ncbi:MAG: (2Fe-2S)-binding protein [Candidatus Eremiobacteraeota bacterium]|nr:(2Fe-2S)-binding protein [Candidatus Eremiobacteraeota bacterium]